MNHSDRKITEFRIPDSRKSIKPVRTRIIMIFVIYADLLFKSQFWGPKLSCFFEPLRREGAKNICFAPSRLSVLAVQKPKSGIKEKSPALQQGDFLL